ncbi:PTS sugar transporter subunit IIC [Anaerocolumna xylanovorans]|uniref:Permease IIC component n=1 Tax=Anaerocolumna xylanovorans DSM 12503 TaxID=1121345 RepID=A0A1M7Y0W1_9FIRM|nr:PTS transporter subunit EIIC [Anaerocolumna xylanovorans]SHO45272.1 PTS system, cellobiose-specific IIC component [Anaerocolumna xylanovorans DSM 12503]
MAKENNVSVMRRINDKVTPVFGKIARERHIQAISGGLMAIVPFTLLAAIFNIIKTPPVTDSMIANGGFWAHIFGGWYNFAHKYNDILSVPSNMTMGMMSIIAVFAISYKLAESYKIKAFSASLISFIMFLLVASPGIPAYLASQVNKGVDMSTLSTTTVLDTTYLGSVGLFVAIIVSLISTEITRLCIQKKITIKMPDAVPAGVAESFSSVIPLLINCLIFYGASLIIQQTAGLSIPAAINKLIVPAIGNVNTPGGILLIITLGNLMWLFGVHGPALFSMLYIPIMFQVYSQNLGIAEAGHAVAFQAIDMTQFSNPYFGLNLVLLFCVASKQLKAIGKASIVPGVFLINEPVIFGIPIMFNPFMVIPVLVIPVVTMGLSWILGSAGWLTGGYNIIFAQLPIGLNAFLASMNVRNLIFAFIMYFVQFLIWLPFVKAYDKQLKIQELEREKSVETNA